MSTIAVTPNLMAAADFAERYCGEYVELVAGRVVRLRLGFARHGQVCARSAYRIGQHVDDRVAGTVFCGNGFVQTATNPDTVRGPDVAYYSYERLPKSPLHRGLLPVAPDLVVEVRQEGELWTGLYAKVGEFLKIGVRAVVILDPDTQTASVYRGTELPRTFSANQDLTIPDILPGFAVRVSALFE